MENLDTLRSVLKRERGPRLKAFAEIAKRYLANVPRESPITTTDLAERIWPVTHVHSGEDAKMRLVLFDCLRYCAPDLLAEHCWRGAARRLRGRGQMIRPWLWACAGKANEEAHFMARKQAEKSLQDDVVRAVKRGVRQLGYIDTERIVLGALHEHEAVDAEPEAELVS